MYLMIHSKRHTCLLVCTMFGAGPEEGHEDNQRAGVSPI